MRHTQCDVAQRANMIKRIAAVQASGGCEIRTREGLHPTRFPTLLTGVHQCPLQFAASADACRVATGERLRTGVNEPRNEPTGWTAAGRGARPRGLRRAIRHRPRVYRTWAESWFAFAAEQRRTGENETETEPTGRRAGGGVARIAGGAG